MTTLLDRAVRATRATAATAQRSRQRPDAVVAAAAGAWAAMLGLIAITVVVLIGWMFAEHGSSSTPDAFRAALRVWLGAHHAHFTLGAAPLTLLPLGLCLLPLGVAIPAGRWLGRTLDLFSPQRLARAVSVFTLGYLFMLAALSPVASTGAVAVHPVPALLWSLLAVPLGVGVGAAQVSGLVAPIWASLPTQVAAVLAGALAGLASLIALGAAVVTGLLAGSIATGADLARRLEPGLVGGALLFAMGVAYLPTLVVWSIAVLVGPGFSVGVGTSISFTGVDVGAVPAFPLLATLPADPLPPGAQALPLLVVAAGVMLGLVVRRRFADASLGMLLRAAAGASATAGAGLGLLCLLASGSLGAGRMAVLGPVPWQVAVLGALEMLVGAASVIAILGWRSARWLRPRWLSSRDASASGPTSPG